jgi:hypothetical protein
MECKKCTFVNHPELKFCELCEQSLTNSVVDESQQGQEDARDEHVFVLDEDNTDFEQSSLKPVETGGIKRKSSYRGQCHDFEAFKSDSDISGGHFDSPASTTGLIEMISTSLTADKAD